MNHIATPVPAVATDRPLPRLRAALRAVALLGLGLASAGCSGRSNQGPPRAQPEPLPEALPIALVDQLGSLPDVPLALAAVELPNGTKADQFLAQFPSGGDGTGTPVGPQDAKNLLIAKFCAEAIRLTDRSLWVAAAGGPGEPAQPNGLAYVYGGKRTDVRTASTGGCCPPLFGLDCSGFLFRLFAAAGVAIPEGPAAVQRQAATLTAALDATETYVRLYAEDLGVLDLARIESGDLVYWNDSGGATRHIGIVLADGAGTLAIYQSNGTSGRDAAGNCSEAECAKNQSLRRGPRSFPLAQANTFFADSGYTVGGVVRILAELSGSWNFRLRCQGAAFDVIDAPLEFPVTENNQFQLLQDFFDYTGEPLSGQFDFSYDRVGNVLSCEFGISSPFCAENPFRIERFAVRLDRDDTGYVGTVELFRNGCAGCLAEVRLINQETTQLPESAGPLLGMLLGFVDGQQLGPR